MGILWKFCLNRFYTRFKYSFEYFFWPAVNTARAISVQVQNAIVLFTTNFQAAINPQLIKNVAIGDNLSAQKLLLASSKFSFFLLCLLGIPLIIIAPTVLNYG